MRSRLTCVAARAIEDFTCTFRVIFFGGGVAGRCRRPERMNRPAAFPLLPPARHQRPIKTPHRTDGGERRNTDKKPTQDRLRMSKRIKDPRSPRRRRQPGVISIPWFTRQTYHRFRLSMTDDGGLPLEYETWFAEAALKFARLERKGFTVIQFQADPFRFRAWCAAAGIEANAFALAIYAEIEARRLIRKQSLRPG